MNFGSYGGGVGIFECIVYRVFVVGSFPYT